MQEIIRMLVVLAVICGLSGFTLSYLKESTASVIKAQVLKYVQGPAILSVYTQANNNPIEERVDFTLAGGQKTVTVFPYKLDNKLVGVAIEAKGGGYGGDIGVIVGFDVSKDALLGIGITEMKETPGLGTLIGEPKFTSQFKGQAMPVELKSKGGSIDAVSGATISSSGAITAVQNAAAVYAELKDSIVKQWP